MTLILAESCDDVPASAALVKPWVVVNTGTGAGQGTGANIRTGGGSWFTGTNNSQGTGFNTTEYSYRIPSAERDATMTVGFALRCNSNAVASGLNLPIIVFRASDNSVMGLLALFGIGTNLDRFGVRYYRGDMVANVADSGTTDAVFFVNAWYYLEIKVTMATGATGSVEIRVNNITRASATNVQTSSSGTTVDRVNFASRYTSASATSPYPAHFDDIYINNSLGSVNTAFLGPVSVYQLDPTGAGDSAQWTPTGVANNWDNVNDYSTADYNETNTVGNTDLYQFADLPAAADGRLVHAVMLAGEFVSETAPQNIAMMAKVGGTEVESPSAVIGAPVAPTLKAIEAKPGGGAWTYADVNSAQFGVRLKT